MCPFQGLCLHSAKYCQGSPREGLWPLLTAFRGTGWSQNIPGCLWLHPPPLHDGRHLGAESDQPWPSDSSPTSGPPLLGTGAAHSLPLAGTAPKQENQPTLPHHLGHGVNKGAAGKPPPHLHTQLCPGDWKGAHLRNPRPEDNKVSLTACWHQQLYYWIVCPLKGLVLPSGSNPIQLQTGTASPYKWQLRKPRGKAR